MSPFWCFLYSECRFAELFLELLKVAEIRIKFITAEQNNASPEAFVPSAAEDSLQCYHYIIKTALFQDKKKN